MNYLEFYRLKKEPFSNEPVGSRFYFNSDEHHRAYLRIMHAIENTRGLALLVGDIGTGKTTIARKVLRSLDESKYFASLLVIVQTNIDAFIFLKKIASQLGVEPTRSTKQDTMKDICDKLLDRAHAHKKTVLLIDEAQMLKTKEIMEDLRGLLNIETINKKLLTIILFGLPEIEANLKLDPPLSQRVAVKYHLGALPLQGTKEYIDFKLQVAESNDYIFTKEAYYSIHQYTRGIPRLINTLCDNSLLEGFILRQDLIDDQIIERVAFDIGLGKNYEGYSQREFIREKRHALYENETEPEDYNQKLKEKLKREIIEDLLGLKK